MEIEHGIPIPNVHVHIYPFGDMQIGDSFVIAINKDKDNVELEKRKLRAAMFYRAKRLGCKFVSRACEEGIRVWRVS